MTKEEIVNEVKNDFQSLFKDAIVTDNLSIAFEESSESQEVHHHVIRGAKCPINGFLGEYNCDNQQIKVYLDALSLVEFVGMTNFTVTLKNALYHLIGRWVCSTIRINNKQFNKERFKILGEDFHVFTGQMFGYYACLSNQKKQFSFISFVNVLTPEYYSLTPFTFLNGKDLPLTDYLPFIEYCMYADVINQEAISNYFDSFIDERINDLEGIYELLYPLLTESQKQRYKSMPIIPKYL